MCCELDCKFFIKCNELMQQIFKLLYIRWCLPPCEKYKIIMDPNKYMIILYLKFVIIITFVG